MLYLDTETCGFHGPIVLMQFAYDDEKPILYEVWQEPVGETLVLMEEFANHEGGVCTFNMVYDWFHFVKLYDMFLLFARRYGSDKVPRYFINEIAELEAEARDGPCVKPVTALDLMLFARKGPYQSMMDRKSIRIRRVPSQLATLLSDELEKRIPIPQIYFARYKKKLERQWQIFPVKSPETGKNDPTFKDVVLKFAPSSALKALCFHAGLRDPNSRFLFDDVAPETKALEVGWAPFATALSSQKEDWFTTVGKRRGYTWPGVILDHILHWNIVQKAREYAADDIVDLQLLFHHFGDPPMGDADSILACQLGASRWRGYAVDLEAIKALDLAEANKIKKTPKAPHHVFKWMSEVMSEEELKGAKLHESTKKVHLEAISQWYRDCKCKKTELKFLGNSLDDLESEATTTINPKCPDCLGKGTIKHPAAERAIAVLDARKGSTKRVLYKKLIQAGRLHPAASVIGSLSGRVSGRTEVADGKRAASINALGIQHDKAIRRCFPFALSGMVLNGGDFDAYEVSIADAAYDDNKLREQLLMCNECGYIHTPDEYRTVDSCPACHCAYTACKTCKGLVVIDLCDKTFGCEHHGFVTIKGHKLPGLKKSCMCPDCQPDWHEYEGTFRKIHALFAQELFPDKTYNEILLTKGQDPDLYDKGKRSLFGGVFYGGDEGTMYRKVGIPIEQGKPARETFFKRYAGVGREQQRCYEDFCSLRQPGGIGKKVFWHEPKKYVESLNGFKRFFELERDIAFALYNLMENQPKEWQAIQDQVVRRDRVQKANNAVRTAVIAAAFQLQAAVMRAALNHRIQSTGAVETKNLQIAIWELQPSGVHEWKVQPMNVHDELMCPSKEELCEPIEKIVSAFVERTKVLIPLVKISWKSKMKNWAEK